MADETYESRCPVCGAIFRYKMEKVLFSTQYPIGYVDCPQCGNDVQHTLGYVVEEAKEE